MEFLNLLAQHRVPFLDTLFQLCTYLGQELFVVIVICWLYWCYNKKLAYTLGFSYFSAGLLAQGLKITFRIPRPWDLQPGFHAVPSAVPAATGYSFPSGHTQSATSLYGTLSIYCRQKWLKILFVLTFLAVGFSRMYLGVHTPKDVLTAVVIGIIPAWLCWRLFYQRADDTSHDLAISLILGAVTVFLLIYTIILYRTQTIEFRYAQDCLKAAGAGFGFAAGFYLERHCLNFSLPETARGKILRLVCGLCLTLAIQEGLKPVIGTGLAASVFRYFLVIFWILFLYPLLFTKLASRHKS